MQSYKNKESIYFSSIRFDIKPLLPTFSEKVLEVGCGTGATLKWLKESGYCTTTNGLELFEDVATIASDYVDKVIIGDAEVLISSYDLEQYDLILCLDVLEHMVDPWKFIDNLQKLLKPKGVIIISVPNIRNANVLYDLIFHKSFEYKKNGILDKTHLRFFTKKSAKELMSREGLTITSMIYNPLTPKSKTSIFNMLTLNLLRGVLTTQFLIKSQRNY